MNTNGYANTISTSIRVKNKLSFIFFLNYLKGYVYNFKEMTSSYIPTGGGKFTAGMQWIASFR
jgi:hypothetical protein